MEIVDSFTQRVSVCKVTLGGIQVLVRRVSTRAGFSWTDSHFNPLDSDTQARLENSYQGYPNMP